jgi:hypothetical protein
MPEAAVDEDCNAGGGKNEIRLAKKRITSSPASDFVSAKQSHKRDLGALIAESFHARHYFGSLLSRE